MVIKNLGEKQDLKRCRSQPGKRVERALQAEEIVHDKGKELRKAELILEPSGWLQVVGPNYI